MSSQVGEYLEGLDRDLLIQALMWHFEEYPDAFQQFQDTVEEVKRYLEDLKRDDEMIWEEMMREDSRLFRETMENVWGETKRTLTFLARIIEEKEKSQEE